MTWMNRLAVFTATLVLAVLIAAAATFAYSALVHGAGRIDWPDAFRLGIVLAVVVTWLTERRRGASRT